jgi:hypothetical protein
MADDRKTKAPLLLSFSCQADWDLMKGSDGVRQCEQCSCKVQDISEYSETQIGDLLARVDAGEEICVAFKIERANEKPLFRLKTPLPDFYSISEKTQSPAFQTRRLAQFSFAVATTISLIYIFPSRNGSAIAEPIRKCAIEAATTKGPPSCLEPGICVLTPSVAKKVKLDPTEHGMWLARSPGAE